MLRHNGELIIDVVREKLDINLDSTQIDRSHRVTPKSRNNESTKPRPIIIKFSRYNARQDIYRVRSRLKGSNIYIHEDLTAKRQMLVNKLRSHTKVRKVWTMDGRITALTDANKKIFITNLADIDKL